MRALIRNVEVMPESEWTPWVRANLQLLTECDGWRLIENWSPEPDEHELIAEEIAADTPDPEDEGPKSFWFDGKEYTEEELRRLLN